jgi:hypothetical protein
MVASKKSNPSSWSVPPGDRRFSPIVGFLTRVLPGGQQSDDVWVEAVNKLALWGQLGGYLTMIC